MSRWRGEDTAQKLALIAEGQTAHLTLACGTWAPHGGEQAAEGLTAKLSQRTAPRGEPIGNLAPGLKRSQRVDLPGSGRAPPNHSRTTSGAGCLMPRNMPCKCCQSLFQKWPNVRAKLPAEAGAVAGQLERGVRLHFRASFSKLFDPFGGFSFKADAFDHLRYQFAVPELSLSACNST